MIYLVFVNSDLTWGRGSMVHHECGYFNSEKEAWDFANTLTGIQGRKPKTGNWKDEKYPDVQVRAIKPYNNTYWETKRKLEQDILKKEQELRDLKSKMKNLG